MFTKNQICRMAAVLMVITLLVGACGTAPTPQVEIKEVEVTRAPATIVRFVFAPDPLMKYMQDTGIVAKYEELYNMRLQTISTWDEAAFFGGGHADIASTGDYEVTALAQETGQDYVIFGLYNLGRVPIWVMADSPYQSIKDLKGKKIGVPGALSSTMLWGIMLKETEGVDLRVGSTEFNVIVNEHVVNGELLRRGEIDAGIIIPEALLPEIRDGKVRCLYPECSTYEYYRAHFDPAKQHKGVPGNVFISTKAWFDANPGAVQFFLAVWEEGLKAWKENRRDIIRLYPEDWGIDPNSETFDQDVEVMTKWLTDHDWFVDTVYLDETWIQKESPLFDLMRKTGFMPQDMANPVFVPVKPEPLP